MELYKDGWKHNHVIKNVRSIIQRELFVKVGKLNCRVDYKFTDHRTYNRISAYFSNQTIAFLEKCEPELYRIFNSTSRYKTKKALYNSVLDSHLKNQYNKTLEIYRLQHPDYIPNELKRKPEPVKYNQHNVVIVRNDRNSRLKTDAEIKVQKEKAKQIAEENRLRNLEKKRLLEEKRQEEARIREEQARINKQKKKEEKLQRQIEEKERIEKELASLPRLTYKDLVVRRSVFKCAHNSHRLIDMTAAVTIVNNEGKTILKKVAMGYCSDCQIRFILESQYQQLQKQGFVLLRTTDEKHYIKGDYYSFNEMGLANESVLMQFGYNVNQQEGLSELARHKILANLIDHKIMTKSEIISYLDFFISQREMQSKYQMAVSKWELDRQFVADYKIGHYAQYGINAIKI